jgi:2-polyprenyl-3-methyl-5-hydroxy-6-metoxy-1,4-benzoquinol methylase
VDGEDDVEVARLDAVARRYDPSDATTEFDYFAKRLQAEAIVPWMKGRRVLETGCATGELAAMLAPAADEYEVVEGSRVNIEAAQARNPSVVFHHSLWERFSPTRGYSDILMINALEHVEDPVGLLRTGTQWLEPGGRIHVVVPNSESLHRLVGVELGILGAPNELTESDHRIGHRRVYDLNGLLADVRAAGLSLVAWRGVSLKLLSNSQMLGWDLELLRAMGAVAQRIPEHCSELYVVIEMG